MSLNLTYLDQVARGEAKLALPTRSQPVGTQEPSSWLFCIDRSGSMDDACGHTTRLGAAANAVCALMAQRLQMGFDDLLAVIAFCDRAELVLPFTDCRAHRETIEARVRGIRIGGGTDLLQPLLLAEKLTRRQPAHIILLSDGHGGNPVPVAERLKKRGIVIETIGVANEPADVAADILKRAASVLNGKVLYRFITDAAELTRYFRTEIANRLVKRSDG